VHVENVVLAESDDTVVVEGNHYFPAESLHGKLSCSDHHTVCPGKARPAITTCGRRRGERQCRLVLPEPKEAAKEIKINGVDRVVVLKWQLLIKAR
jgi:uncharacterized protein (DUF427 family)